MSRGLTVFAEDDMERRRFDTSILDASAPFEQTQRSLMVCGQNAAPQPLASSKQPINVQQGAAVSNTHNHRLGELKKKKKALMLFHCPEDGQQTESSSINAPYHHHHLHHYHHHHYHHLGPSTSSLLHRC